MICPNCNQAQLKLISADFPYNEEHYQCPDCDSTYNRWEVDPLVFSTEEVLPSPDPDHFRITSDIPTAAIIIQSPETHQELLRINYDGTVTASTLITAQEAGRVFVESIKHHLQKI